MPHKYRLFWCDVVDFVTSGDSGFPPPGSDPEQPTMLSMIIETSMSVVVLQDVIAASV
jgi:hypothetical protein